MSDYIRTDVGNAAGTLMSGCVIPAILTIVAIPVFFLIFLGIAAIIY